MESSPAIMIRLPEVFGGKEARKLRREVKHKFGNGSACVVVDMSRVKKIDLAGLEALLKCMQEVADQDGAIELGSISPEAAVMLELTRMGELFSRFPAIQAESPNGLAARERVAQRQVSPAVQPQPVAA